jgi:hypothetical protein
MKLQVPALKHRHYQWYSHLMGLLERIRQVIFLRSLALSTCLFYVSCINYKLFLIPSQWQPAIRDF